MYKLLYAILLILTPTADSPLPVGNYYFSATWCGPCQDQSKVVTQLEKMGYKFTKYDWDANPDIFKNLGIKAVPTIIIVKSKDLIIKLKGKQSAKKLIGLLLKEIRDMLNTEEDNKEDE